MCRWWNVAPGDTEQHLDPIPAPIHLSYRRAFAWLRRQVAITRLNFGIIMGNRCPECQSSNVTWERKRQFRHCVDCDFRWEQVGRVDADGNGSSWPY
jgi:Zn ribbon nucleic-acid-binding protein